MNILELKKAVDNAVEKAKECDAEPLEDILISLQIDIVKNDECYKSLFSSDHVELHYDNNGCASGCVLTAVKETKRNVWKSRLLEIKHHYNRIHDLQWCDRAECHKQMVWMEEQNDIELKLATYSDLCECKLKINQDRFNLA